MHKLRGKTIIVIKDIENTHSRSRRCMHSSLKGNLNFYFSIEIKDPKRGTHRIFVLILYQTLNLDDICFPNIHSIAISLKEDDKMYQNC